MRRFRIKLLQRASKAKIGTRAQRRKSSLQFVTQSAVVAGAEIEESSVAAVKALNLPRDLEDAVLSIDIFSAVVLMRDGTYLMRYPRFRVLKPQNRLFTVNMDLMALRWSAKAKGKYNTLPLDKITRIVPGVNSAFWRLKQRREKVLGIEIIAGRRKIRVVTSDQREWLHWMRGLCYIYSKAKSRNLKLALANQHDTIKEAWDKVAVTSNIQLNQLLAILSNLSINADARYIAYLFQIADEDGSQVLDYGDFRELITRLTRCPPEVHGVWADYTDEATGLTDPTLFKAFLVDIQGEMVTEAERQLRIIETLKEPYRIEGKLSSEGYDRLLRSDWNSILSQVKQAHTLVHDMSFPLSQYWIKSCWDPFEDTLPGIQAGVDALSECLTEGCRLIRVNIVQSPEAKDGFSVVTDRKLEIPCRLVLRTIKENAFNTTLEPLVLLIEVQASFWSLSILAAIVEDELGSMVYRPSENKPRVPEELRKRILIASKRLTADVRVAQHRRLSVDDELLREFERISQIRDAYQKVDLFKSLVMPPKEAGAILTTETKHLADLNEVNAVTLWNQLVTYTVLYWSDESREFDRDEILLTIGYDQLMRLTEEELAKLMTRTSRMLTVAHPTGSVSVWSNAGFLTAHSIGVQCAAIAQRIGGASRTIASSLFIENGQCGYVPKPRHLREGKSTARLEQFAEGGVLLRVKIVSGHQLPRTSPGFLGRDPETRRPRDSLSPYVTLHVQSPQRIQVKRTKTIWNNGFSPVWNQEFEFRMDTPSTTFITFQVLHDDDCEGTSLGSNSVTVTSLRKGIRWVPLYDVLSRCIPWAGLFVYVTVRATQVISRKPKKPSKANMESPSSVTSR